MRPLKLVLKNFIGIRNGLGRDVLEFDVEQLAGTAVLVALAGPNGAGKTTILDNLHPYRVMPFRASGYSPGSFSFFDQIYGGEAEKTLEWSLGSELYRSTLLFKFTAKTKKTEAYLHRKGLVGWEPYTAPDGTISDGKTTTYDACLNGLLGTPELFFSSAFSAQNRKQLVGYTNGDIKELMAELLGLESVRELGKKASEVCKGLRSKREVLQDEARAVDSWLNQLAIHADAMRKQTEALGLRQEDVRTGKAAVQQAMRAVADAKSMAESSASILGRKLELERQLKTLDDEHSGRMTQCNADIAADKARSDRELQGINIQIRSIDSSRQQIALSKARHATVLARATGVEAAKAAQAALERASIEAARTLEDARGDVASYRKQRDMKSQLEAQVSSLSQEGKSSKAQHADCTLRAELIHKVPCEGTDLQPRCPLLANAREADSRLPALTEHLETLRTHYAKGSESLKVLTDSMGADPEPGLRALERKAQEAVKAVSDNEAIIALEAGAEAARAAIADADAQFEQSKAEAATLNERLVQMRSDHEDSSFALFGRKQTLIGRHTEQRNLLDVELGDLGDTGAAEKAIAAAEAALLRAETQLEQSESTVRAIQDQQANIAAAAREGEKRLAACKSALAQSDHLAAEIAHYTLLSKALGNDGIIALSIDDAGPSLTAIANDFLSASYGPRFSLRIDTQRDTASGTQREEFDIRVFDAEAGDEKSIKLVSGGERIWLNDALTRSIAVYQAQQSGQRYECLLTDESDGALDADKKTQFMQMKRKVLELGGYRSEIFISHSPELWAMADAVIDMEDLR